MVLPMAAAARGAAAAGSAGATALGLKMGASDLDLTQELFKLQMRQAKRLWTADYAEASFRHGEACMQAAQQHAEAQALAMAAYYQAEKLAAQQIKLARDQDQRSYEMSWRSEVRESLRDELTNQNNRFNIVMLCDTVCLGCVFSLIADGSPPLETSLLILNMYVLAIGLSIMLFVSSLWCSVIVVRRLHEHTASTLERKLFAQSDELQSVWKAQLDQNLPTGPKEQHMINQAYEGWVAEYIDPLGKLSIHLMSIGVVAMFITAGLLMHAQYLHDYQAPTCVVIFWSTVAMTSIVVMLMKTWEDRIEKKKLNVYDNSWKDKINTDTGPFAKITRAAQELFSQAAVSLGSVQRMESLTAREHQEQNYCCKTKSLNHRVNGLQQEASQRAKIRKEILQLLTTATEELDALPEELTSHLNKVLHDIDEADTRTANLVSTQSETNVLAVEASQRTTDWTRLGGKQTLPQHHRPPMAPVPLDAQRTPVSLSSIRKKLGEISLTTLLRIKNLSDEPLRLKSGVQLKSGKYLKTLDARNRQGNPVCHHLYPVSEIPPRTEIVIAARSAGLWLPTSGIDGEIVYMNRDETWAFRITFTNELVRHVRRCTVQASHVGKRRKDNDDSHADDNDNGSVGNADSNADDASTSVVDDDDQYWYISRDEVDRKANNETVVTIDVRRGGEAIKAANDRRQAKIAIKSGFLLKNKPFGLRLHWQQQWFVLTPSEIIYSKDMNVIASSKTRKSIPIKHIQSVQPGFDIVHKNVFEVRVVGSDGEPRLYKLDASTPAERDDWIQNIRHVMKMRDEDMADSDIEANKSTSEASVSTAYRDGYECVESETGTQVMQIDSSRQSADRFLPVWDFQA